MAQSVNGAGRSATVLVVSDLHLGGDLGFQMCSPAGQQRLTEFLRWAGAQRATDRDLHLVLAGDVVDFLAETNADGSWSAFTDDERKADAKLAAIIDRTRPVWQALRDLASDGVAITVLLGNHDIELSLPAPRRRLVSEIAPRGRLDLLYDGEAFRLGELLIEHGNRYEGWNAVVHDSLRRVRSRLSRGEPPGDFPVQPGSELVVRVMNPIKRKLGFIDLLKPETSGAIPILAVLDPGVWRSAAPFMRQAAAAAWRQLKFEPSGMPAPVDDIALEAVATSGVPSVPDADAFDLADQLAAQEGTVEAAVGAEEGLLGTIGRRIEVGLLLRAFRKRVEKDGESFQVDRESELYLKPARVLASRGARVVVFGHTHHAKRVALGGGATYLNTGTWADLMRIPEVVYTGRDGEARAALETFLGDLEADRLDELRRRIPTFARVEVDAGGRVEHSDVLFFDGPGAVEPITNQGVLTRLGFGAAGGAERALEAVPSAGVAPDVDVRAASPVALVVHADEDGAFAQKELVPLLPSNGYGRWISFTPGSSVPVDDAARAAQVALVLVSQRAAASGPLGSAAGAVVRAGTPVVPVVLDGTAPGRIARELERAAIVDFTGSEADPSKRDDARLRLANLLPPAARSAPGAEGAPWIQSIPWDGGVFSAELARAVDRRDPLRIDQLVESFERLVPSSPHATAGNAPEDLKRLRSRRAFSAMLRYADAAIRAGMADAEVRRQRGQALIELGEFPRAIAALEAIAVDPSAPFVEQNEAYGLLGRAYKQQYVDHPERAAALLAGAIGAYRHVYDVDERMTWHGINLATCLLRSSRDGGGMDQAREAAEVAANVLETLRLREIAKPLEPFDLATRLEALVILGRREEAAAALDQYLADPGLTAFEVSSTHRQLAEVLQADRIDWSAALLQQLARAVERYRTGGAPALTREGEKSDASTSRSLLIRTTDPGWEPRDIPGLQISATLGTVISARGGDAAVRALLREPRVVTVEEDRAAGVEECAVSVPFIGATAVHAPEVGEKGAHALVAVIDNGIDVLHEAFLDDQGKSRIEEIWDQRDRTGPPPEGFSFGTVHTRERIAAYVAGTEQVPPALGRNVHGHGTHVASIAAGRAAGAFAGGVAPEARLLIVVSSLQGSIGYSESHLAALSYIDRFATKRELPVVVNVSQGMNAGAHDGKSALEVGFDEFTKGGRRTGRVVVKSAGNERANYGHAQVSLKPESAERLSWTRSATFGRERLELWFSAADQLRFRLVDPTERSSGWTGHGEAPEVQGSLGTTSCRLQFTKRHIDNGESQLLVELGSENPAGVQLGAWRLEIESKRTPEGGLVHAWLERGSSAPSCFTEHQNEAMTLSIPGTAGSVITVAAVGAAKPIQVGKFSSYGPTRDGRRKPDLCAPGNPILAADGGTRGGVRPEAGTSMAAPHVAGAVALLLSRRPRLTATQIASAICQNTLNYDGHWDPGQGWGVVDVKALLEAFP